MSTNEQPDSTSLAPEVDAQTEEFLQQYDLYGINLTSGEKILEVTSDHFLEVLPYLVIPVLMSIVGLALAIYHGVGGQFLSFGLRPETPFDPINIVLLALLAVALLTWFSKPAKAAKPSLNRTLLLVVATIMGLVILYRSQGGRFFSIDPLAASGGFFRDWIGVGFLLFAAVGIGLTIYRYIESENDNLIVTNRRVILFDRQILGKQQLDQVLLEDIQNVAARSDTYLQYWLNFGDLAVISARKEIKFKGAERPNDIQKAIMGQVNAMRGQDTDLKFRDMIHTGIYGEASSLPQVKPSVPISRHPRLLQWIVPENPEVDGKGTITWRHHWIFLFMGLVKPALFAFLGFFAIIIAASFTWLTPIVSGLLVALVVFVFVMWAWYDIEDYRNDIYILTRTNFIDVEQKPWGPEHRRTAGLGALQNVTSNTTLLSRWIGYGDVVLVTAGTGNFTFYGIPNPDMVVKMINTYHDDFRRGDKERTLQDVIKLIKYYHAEEDRRRHREEASAGS